VANNQDPRDVRQTKSFYKKEKNIIYFFIGTFKEHVVNAIASFYLYGSSNIKQR